MVQTMLQRDDFHEGIRAGKYSSIEQSKTENNLFLFKF